MAGFINGLLKDGTVTVENGSTTIVFTGIDLLSAGVEPDDPFMLAGHIVPIDSITDESTAELREPWPGDDATGADYAIQLIPDSQRILTKTAELLQDFLALQAITETAMLFKAANKATLAATPSSVGSVYLLGREASGDGGQGQFAWNGNNLSTQVAADTYGAIYVPPTGQNGSAGAWVRVLPGYITPEMFGAKTDGANYYGQLVAAMMYNAAVPLRLSAGTYVANIPSGSFGIGILPAGKKIIGEGKNRTKIELRMASGDTTYRHLITLLNGGINFEGLELDVVTQSGNTFSIFRVNGSVRYSDVRLKSNVTYTGSTPSAETFLWDLGTGSASCNSFIFENGSEVYGHHYNFLKTNTSTSTQKNFLFRTSSFYGTGGINLNSPNGVFEGVTIDDCLFEDFIGDHGDNFPVALASISGWTISNCRFRGRIDNDAIHIEEESDDCLIVSNTFDFESAPATSNGGNGIVILENDEAAPADDGNWIAPKRLIVANNTFKKRGTKNGRAIWATYNTNNAHPVENSIIQSNIVDGFDVGIQTGDGLDTSVSVRDNHVKNCNTGLYAYRATEQIDNNTVENCTVGVLSYVGGIWGKIHFRGTIGTYVGAAVSGGQILTKWTMSVSEASHAGGGANQNFVLMPTAERISGNFAAYASRKYSNTHWSTQRTAVTYDGTTFTATRTVHGGGGGGIQLANPALVNSSGNLALSVFDTPAGLIHYQVSFDGFMQFT